MRWILLILLLCLFGLQYRLWIGPGSLAHVAALERELEEQTRVNDQLQQRNQLLEYEVNNLKSGLESVEERARSELGLIKKDETFYLLIENDK